MTGVGCHFLLHGMCLTKGSNSGLLLCRLILYHLRHHAVFFRGYPGGSVVKNPPSNAAGAVDTNLILRSGRSPREASGNPLQYSHLQNPMDRGAWQATVQGVAKDSHAIEQWNMVKGKRKISYKIVMAIIISIRPVPIKIQKVN